MLKLTFIFLIPEFIKTIAVTNVWINRMQTVVCHDAI